MVMRLLRLRWYLWVVVCLVLINKVGADEIRGKIVDVDGSTVRIELEEAYLPALEDTVKIGFTVPGVGFVALEGQWKIAG